MEDNEVKPIIRRKIDESITPAFEVLERIDKLVLINQIYRGWDKWEEF